MSTIISYERARGLRKTRKIILDTDIGTDADDSLALILAVKSPELKVEAVTVVSDDVEQRAKLALRVLQVCGIRDIPVAMGLTRPLFRSGNKHWAGFSGHGIDLSDPKLVPSSEHAVNLIVSKLMASTGDFTLVTIGPLTNIAAALIIEPRIVHKIREAFIMGGMIRIPEGVHPLLEYNLSADPEASRIVLNSRMPITVAGWDITHKVVLNEEHLMRIKSAHSPLTDLVVKMVKHFQQNILKQPCMCLHDPLTVGVSVDKTLVKTRRMFVGVETKGELTTGHTVAYTPNIYTLPRIFKPLITPRITNAEVATEVEADRFLEMFLQRIMS